MPPSTVVPETETAEAAKFKTPVPAAVSVPVKLRDEGTSAVTPPVKAVVPDKVRVPVFENVVAPAIELEAPVRDTL